MIYKIVSVLIWLSNKMSSQNSCFAVALNIPVINGTEYIFVVYLNTSRNGFFYFSNQIIQVILSQLLKEVCVLRFHNSLFNSVFNFSFLKGSGCFPFLS